MKSIFIFVFSIFLSLPLQPVMKNISQPAKKDLLPYLESTKLDLSNSLEKLSKEQMVYKPGPDKWSIAESVEHIVTVEAALYAMLKQKLSEPETPDLITEIAMTDDEVIAFITDRSQKAKTSPDFVPSGKFSTSEEAFEAFEEQREGIVDFIKESEFNLRNYVFEFPFGKLDAYQTLLFLAGHTARHTQQIEEVKQSLKFPQ